MTFDDVDQRGAGSRRSPRRRTRLALAAGLALTACLFVASPGAAEDATPEDAPRTTPVPGTTSEHTLPARGDVYRYLQYTPKTYRPNANMPLLVMVHGCQTTAEKEQELTQLDRVADREGFVVVYPDVGEVGRNAPGPLNQCWNFLDPRSKHRDQGDGAVIAEMTRTVMADLSIDPERVYLVGISAGGLMTSISAAAYPDLYAAVGIAASSAYGDWTCLGTRIGLPVATSARNAFQEMGERARVVPTFVIGGDKDVAFASACQHKALEQGLRTNNLVISGSQTAPISLKPATTVEGQVPGGHAYTVQTYEDPDGCVVGERWNVHGMGHFWSGGTDDEKGPEGAEAVWTFLERFTKSGTAMPCAEADAPVPLENLTPPRITGKPQVGSTLKATNGTWSRTDITVEHQWLLNGEPITGATGSSYKPSDADVDGELSVAVTASADGLDPVSAVSSAVVVAPPPAEEPDPQGEEPPPNQGSGPNEGGSEVPATTDELPDTGGPGLPQLVAGVLALGCGVASMRLSQRLVRPTDH